MVFGIEPIEFVLFLRQVGLALAGAAALWGFVIIVARQCIFHEEKKCLVLEWVSERLMIPFLIGTALAALSWLTLVLMVPVSAHEGVSIASEIQHVYHGLELFTPLMLVWVLVSLAGFVLLKARQAFFHRNITIFYGVSFVLALILISFQIWTGEFGKEQWFFVGHSAHSILTVGTVLVLDFLFLTAKSSKILKQHIYPLFPTVSKVIWVGLGIDFLSAVLIFSSDTFVLTDTFLFMQTLIGILIINGVLLSGPITRRLIASVERGGKEMERNWTLVADLGGAISITSWLTITFVDSFAGLTLSYGALMLFYVLTIAFLFVGHLMWDHMRSNHAPVLLRQE